MSQALIVRKVWFAAVTQAEIDEMAAVARRHPEQIKVTFEQTRVGFFFPRTQVVIAVRALSPWGERFCAEIASGLKAEGRL